MDFGVSGKTDAGGFEVGGTASASAGELRCLGTINHNDFICT